MEQGSIVTVHCPESSFDGAQGEVVKVLAETEEEDVLVKFGPAHSHLVGHCLTEKDGWIAFCEKDLQKEEDWNWENRAILLFGESSFHHVYTYKDEFVAGQPCKHRDCEQPTTRRIMVNIWGTVMEKDVCAQHAEQYHGKRLDEFPDKQ
ncbi:hypothetical protein ACFL2U_00775 [Patescibacteria group bacterium]